jgi:uncharacterized iron-regulated membrane protein
MFRKVLFWIHLATGLIAGLAIAVMCATGVILSFEKQLVAWAERDARVIASPETGASRLTLSEMLQRVEAARPTSVPSA